MFKIILVAVLIVISFAILSYRSYCKTHDKWGDPIEEGETFSIGIAFIPLVIATFVVGTSSFYTQDPGEVVVVRNLGGSLAGYTEEAGFHAKAPWQDTVSYDVRNNLINLYRDADYHYDGGAAEGACVTINDKGGASADVDLQVVYSLDGDSALRLYEDYGTQEHFTSAVIQNDVRATAREVAGRFDTITLLTNRGEFTRALQAALTEKWESIGLNVEQVSVQDVRYPDSITSKYAEAQSAEIARQQAVNEQETARVQAETLAIQAQAEADANRILSESLTPEVIQERYIEALEEIGKHDNLIVVPEGSAPMVSVGE